MSVPKSDMMERSLTYAGWRVTLAAFVGVMVSFAALVPYTFSLYLAPLQAEFGWKREAISRAFAIAALTVAACSPTIGTAQVFSRSRRRRPVSASPRRPESTRPASDFVYGSTRRPRNV